MNQRPKTPFAHKLRACTVALLAAGSCLAACSQSTQPPAPPASGPMGAPPGPPPEAVQACNGKSAGTACSFTGRRGGTMSGQCASGPAGRSPGANGGGNTTTSGSGNSSSNVLACRPAGGPPPGMPGGPGGSGSR